VTGLVVSWQLSVGTHQLAAVSWQLAAIPNFLLQTAHCKLLAAHCKLQTYLPSAFGFALRLHLDELELHVIRPLEEAHPPAD
jgi:hypothetical protein